MEGARNPRPLPVTIYCGVIVAFFAVALILVGGTAFARRSLDATSIAVSFVPASYC